jgi:hypothetical protein
MIMAKVLPVLAAVAAAFTLAACAPSVATTDRAPASPPSETNIQTAERTEIDEPVESPSPVETEPQIVGGENVEAFFRAMASQDPRDMKAMADLAADDSPAKTYARVQYALVVAEQQSYGGGMTGPQIMRITDDGGIELSSEPLGYEGDVEETVTFTDFELTGGKLASFSAINADDDEPISIDDRIVPGGQRQEIAGNTVRLMGAYHSVQADTVIVVLSTEATGDSIEYGYSDTYETSDGREVASTQYVGDDTPRAGREGPYVVSFDSVDLGGTAFIEAMTTSGYDTATLKFNLQPGA